MNLPIYGDDRLLDLIRHCDEAAEVSFYGINGSIGNTSGLFEEALKYMKKGVPLLIMAAVILIAGILISRLIAKIVGKAVSKSNVNGAAKSFLVSFTHHLAHVADGGGAHLGDDLLDLDLHFLGGELLGEVFLQRGGLGHLVVGEVLAVAGDELFGGFLALFHELLDHLEDVAVGDFLGTAFRGLEKKDFSFDRAVRAEGHRVLRLHRFLDGFLDLLFERHNGILFVRYGQSYEKFVYSHRQN